MGSIGQGESYLGGAAPGDRFRVVERGGNRRVLRKVNVGHEALQFISVGAFARFEVISPKDAGTMIAVFLAREGIDELQVAHQLSAYALGIPTFPISYTACIMGYLPISTISMGSGMDICTPPHATKAAACCAHRHPK
eukprot:1242441-Pleurochrysis_carterae.AAC.2